MKQGPAGPSIDDRNVDVRRRNRPVQRVQTSRGGGHWPFVAVSLRERFGTLGTDCQDGLDVASDHGIYAFQEIGNLWITAQ